MNEGGKVWKAKSMAWVRKYERFHDEVLEYELETQKSFSVHNTLVFLLYGIICLLWDKYILGESIVGALLCFGISALSLADFIVCKYFLEKHMQFVAKVTNIYILLFTHTIMFIDMLWNDRRGGNVSWTLLVCAIITTSTICIVPHHYAAVIIIMVVLDTVDGAVGSPDIVAFLYNLLDSVIIAIFCISMNVIFSKRQYNEFMRKEELKYESNRDALTNLYNRRYIERYYGLHAETDKLCAIIMVDLDNFKKANDAYGHEMGDWVLCRTGDLLREYFGESDCIARLGGDEFAVFLHGLEDRGLKDHGLEAHGIDDKDCIAQRTRKLLGEFPIVLGDNGSRVEVSVSIGIAFKNPGENIDYSKLCSRADEVMYMAKRMGKGKAVISLERNKRDVVIVA
jgi:diguanylate cyclase (GGDEF)-like protein